MSEFTFLTEEQASFTMPMRFYKGDTKYIIVDKQGIEYIIRGNKLVKLNMFEKLNKKYKEFEKTYDHRIEIIKKTDGQCTITDFAILLGGYADKDGYITEDSGRKIKKCKWWTKTNGSKTKSEIYIIDEFGDISRDYENSRNIGARPAISYSLISSKVSNIATNDDQILEVEYGEYPQMVVSEDLSKTLEAAYSKGIVKQTGKSYTTNSVQITNNSRNKFKERKHTEYEYKGKKYIRFVGDSNCSGKTLSDGRIVQVGVPYWIEVSPIKWLVDKTEDIALSKYALFSGMLFSAVEYNGEFKDSSIKKFMDKYFSIDIIPSVLKKQTKLTKGEEITELILEIEKYLLPNAEKELILKEIQILINKYNEELENIRDEYVDDNVCIEVKSPNSLYQNICIELNLILDKVKNNFDKTKHYYDILDILDKIISILKENKEIDSDNDIIKTFNTINFQIIPLISVKNTLKDDILNTMLEEKRKIEQILKDKEYTQCINIKEWEISFRKKLQQILLNILRVIDRQDMITVINQYISDNLPEINEKYSDKLVALYLREIINLSEIIKNKTNDPKYLKMLDQLLSIEIDDSKTLGEIITYLSQKIANLYRLNIEIDEEQKKNELIDDYKVKL